MAYICSITFPNRWVLSLRALFCQATYAGHLEVPHTRRLNDGLIRKLMAKATELFGPTPVHLVDPVRTVGAVIEAFEFDGEPVVRQELPAVCCIGAFEAGELPGTDGFASGLVVVWFQEEPPPVPIEADLVNLFADIRWDELATSYWR